MLKSPSSFRASPRMDFDSKSPDCLQLCMDVPFPDHPYLIGPRGRKSQYFMTRYKSLIHFPDTNCRQDGVKLNNVLVSGKMKNVEEIRSQIRLRTPIRVVVQLRQFQNCGKVVRRIEEAISQRSLPIRFTYADDFCSGVLKTEWRNEDLLVDFCEEFMNAKFLNKKAPISELFTLAIALLPLINPWNNELSHRLVGNLYEQTGCRVFYPNKEKYVVEPPTYFVKGASVAGLLQSGKYLMGLTMLQVTFHLPPNSAPSVQQQMLDDWQQNLLVHTTIFNPSPNDPLSQYRVTLRSFEFCVNGVYAVRSALLGFKKSVSTPCYDFMKLAKHIIPYTVFCDAKLFYPLYSVDDKNLNWSSDEFFERFYGCPYTLINQPVPLAKAVAYDENANSVSVLTNQMQRKFDLSEGNDSELEQQSSDLELTANTTTSLESSSASSAAAAPLPPPFSQSDFHHHFVHQFPPPVHSITTDINLNATPQQQQPQFVFFHTVDTNNNNNSEEHFY
ncbi:hypothetical protein niasHS_010056 [Heterodera schachtii]|uniref:Argonaute n=1 Tax=Heterodera schachtii TaxID=97005 RepID=A0ABD2J0T7_HETSC